MIVKRNPHPVGSPEAAMWLAVQQGKVLVRADVLTRVLDFITDFHGDDLPENAPNITADMIALFDAVRPLYPEIAERQIKLLSEPLAN